MRLKTRATKTLTGLVLLLASLLTASAQDFQIRTRVDLVVVPVSVKGSGDDLISGLTGDDFIIYEDGKRQELRAFSVDPVPISAAVLVDTGLSYDSYEKVKSSFPALAEAFSDFDEVTIYRFDKFVTKVLDFTADKIMVETTLRTLQEPAPARNTGIASGPFSASGPVINGAPVIPGGPEPAARVSPAGTKVLHKAIYTAANALAARDANRRRIILVVSDGQAKNDDISFDEARDRLLDHGVQVYAVGMDMSFLSRRFSALNSYAEATGGAACFLTSLSAMEECYARSAEEARNQYVLAYVSSNESRNPLPVYREIEIELRRPGLDARHRKGYFQHP